MAQYARPDAVLTLNGWTGSVSAIGETSVDDATYMESPSAPSTSNYLEVSLSDVSDPLSSSGHVVTYRYAKNASGGAQINLTVQLRQGSTVIASQTHTNIGSSVTEGTFTLSGPEADAITDYTDLRLRFIPEQV